MTQSRPLLPEDVLKALTRARTRVLLFGGLAEVLIGSPLPTHDVDLLIPKNKRSAGATLSILRKLGYTAVGSNGAPLPVSRGKELLMFNFLRFTRPHAPPVDVWTVPPTSSFDTLWRRRVRVPLGRGAVSVPSLPDMIENRTKFLQAKNIDRLEYLEKMREELK